MKELALVKKTKGINAQIENNKVSYGENGFEYLNYAINVDIADGYKILRRRGFADTTHTDAAHSIYAYNGKGYCVLGTNLYMLDQGLNKYGVRNNFSNRKVRYCGVGDKVYYSNGVLNGYIQGGVSYPWAPSSYVGPDSDVLQGNVTSPPVCRHLALFKGRILLSEDSTLWYTQPFWYDGLNRATDFIQFSSTITMILPLDNIMLIGTEEEVILISGTAPDDFTMQSLIKCRPLEDTGIVHEGFTFKDRVIPGKTGIFTTQKGIYAVLNSGDVIDITENRLLLPDAVSGNAYIKDNFYTVLIDE